MKSLWQTIISILTTFTLFLSMLGITFNKTTKVNWEKAYDMTDARYQITYREKAANSEREIQYRRDGTTVYYLTDYTVAGIKVLSLEQYYSKEDSTYYNYQKNILGVWTKEAITEEQYNSAVSKTCICDFKGVFKYEDFEYDTDLKYYKAAQINHTVTEGVTDVYTDVTIKFVNNRITSLNATQVDGVSVVTKTMDITYTSLPILLPIVSE